MKKKNGNQKVKSFEVSGPEGNTTVTNRISRIWVFIYCFLIFTFFISISKKNNTLRGMGSKANRRSEFKTTKNHLRFFSYRGRTQAHSPTTILLWNQDRQESSLFFNYCFNYKNNTHTVSTESATYSFQKKTSCRVLTNFVGYSRFWSRSRQ